MRDAGSYVRLIVLIARPQLITLLVGFALLGMAVGSGGLAVGPVLAVAGVVVAFVVAAVAVNDLADVAVDRINVPGDRRRPLLHEDAEAQHRMVVVALGAGLLALGGAGAAGGARAAAVVAGGLALVVGYSLPPLRLSARGAVAALVLPAGYVAVPFLTGLLVVGGELGGEELALLAAAYVGFVGRILLKDFRDLTGDTLLGKRTFLVRHGQRLTCAVAGACWVLGSSVTQLVAQPSAALDLAYAVRVALALWLLALLGAAANPRRQTALIAAIAVLGRGLVVALVLHLLAAEQQVPLSTQLLLQGLVLAADLATAWRMIAQGRSAQELSSGSAARAAAWAIPSASRRSTTTTRT